MAPLQTLPDMAGEARIRRLAGSVCAINEPLILFYCTSTFMDDSAAKVS